MATIAEPQQIFLIKKGQWYLFRYHLGEERDVIQNLIEKAEDPKCPLDWFDAALLAHQMGSQFAANMQTLLKNKRGQK